MTNHPPEITPPPWVGGPNSIKRHGVNLTHCDSEPVQTPGCTQAHGAMLVRRLADLTILQANENTADHLDMPPAHLLGQAVDQVVVDANAVHLQALLAGEPLEGNAIYAFTLPARENTGALDASVHTSEALPNAAGPLVELAPLANPDNGRPLNMTHCALRGASVMHIEYLANMGMAASLTMPIPRDGESWGSDRPPPRHARAFSA